MMKKLMFIILLFFGFITLNAQTYSKSVTVKDFGTWDKELPSGNKITISSYVTKEKILTYENFAQIQKTVTKLPKYRYQLMLTSNSIYNGKLTKTWIYNAKVFIDSTEVTHSQFPDGFTAIIETTPTVIYWYESSLDTINIKITWKNSIYFKDNN